MVNQGTILSIAIAAKGLCHPAIFIKALKEEGLTENKKVSINIAHDELWENSGASILDNITLHQCKQGISVQKLWGTAIERSNRGVIKSEVKCNLYCISY